MINTKGDDTITNSKDCTQEIKSINKLTHLYWIIGVLVAILVFTFTYKFWGKNEDVIDLISIGSGLTSIALAIVAIIIAVGESIKTNNKEIKTDTALKTIVSNIDIMNRLVNKLEKDNVKTHGLIEQYISQISSFDHTTLKEDSTNNQSTENRSEATIPNNEDNQNTPLNVEDSNENKHPKNDDVSQKKSHKKQSNNLNNCKRGDIFFADLSAVVGSEQGGTRPVLIISNDISNRFSPTVTIAAITAQIQKAKLPTHVEINAEKYNFERDSVILLEQVRTIDKSRLSDRITSLDSEIMSKVNNALEIQYGLVEL